LTTRAAVSEIGPTGVDSVHERYFGHEYVSIIEPIKGWRALDIKELWAYRELLCAHHARTSGPNCSMT
jgi:hypothetical protein